MRTGIISVTAAAAFCIFALGIFNGRALAQDKHTLYYSCSNQIYQALDKEKLASFARDTGIQVSVSTMSSDSAVSQLMYGCTDLASTAWSLYGRHIERGLRQIPVCKDPLAVIARKDCGVESLTEKQVQGIFSGIITNWKEVGGKDLDIIVIVPSDETAASKNFRRQLMKHRDIKYDMTTWNSTMAAAAVKYFPCGAVSFIGRGSVASDPDVRSIKIDGKLPRDPHYPYYQIFFYVIRGDKAGGAAGKFIDYTLSEKGRRIIQESGMTTIDSTTFWKGGN